MLLCFLKRTMQPNFKRGFNRLFIALTVLWAVYCLVVYPMQKWSEAYKEYGAHIEANCWAARGNELEDCRKYEEISSGVGMWTLKAYYTRESWLLALVVVAVPLLSYGLLRGLMLLGTWFWRGFTSETRC